MPTLDSFKFGVQALGGFSFRTSDVGVELVLMWLGVRAKV